MNQCVPRWNLEDNNQPFIPTVPPSDLSFRPSGSNSHSNSTTRDVSLPDYEVAELTWENGNLSMQGLGLPRVSSKPQRSSSASPTTTTTTKYTTCDQKHGTLESIVNQATQNFHTYSPDNLLVPLIDNTHHHPNISSPVVLPSTTIPATTVDALVPTPTTTPLVSHPIVPQSTINGSTCVIAPSTRVGSCSGTAPCPRYDLSEEVGPLKLETSLARVPLFKGHEQPQQSVSLSGGSNTFGWDSRCVTLDTCDKGGLGLTTTATTSFCSPGNTSSAAAPGGNSHAGGDDHDFVCHSKPQQGDGVDEEQKKKGTAKSSASTKRSRAAAVHNQSERKRRNKINQKMDELQKLVPNSNKTDKASLLDEAIEYLKQLQAQFHMMSRMSFPSMMMPLAMQQQQLQMSMMAMAPMGMGMGMDLNSMARQNIAGIPHPSLMNPQAFMPLPTWDGASNDRSQPSMVPTADPLSTYLGYHSQQPMTMDAYSRMAALYNHQLMQQRQGPGSNS